MKRHCPQCGADLKLRAADRLVTCGFCATSLVVEADQAVFHEVMAPTIRSEDEARARLRRFFASAAMPPGFHRRAKIRRAQLEFFPFWTFADDSGEGRDTLIPAAPTAIQGLHGWRLPAGERRSMAAEIVGKAPTNETTVPLTTARDWLAVGRSGAPVGRSLLLHLPLFRASYLYQGRELAAMIDAVSGRVFLAESPHGSETPYRAVLVLALLVFGIEGMLIDDIIIRFAAYAVSILPMAGLTWALCRRL